MVNVTIFYPPLDFGASNRERERERWGQEKRQRYLLIVMIGIDSVVQMSLESSLFLSQLWDSTISAFPASKIKRINPTLLSTLCSHGHNHPNPTISLTNRTFFVDLGFAYTRHFTAFISTPPTCEK